MLGNHRMADEILCFISPAPIKISERCAKGEYTRGGTHASANPQLMWCKSRKGARDHRTSKSKRKGQIFRNFSRIPGARKSTAQSRKVRTGIRSTAVKIMTVNAQVANESDEKISLISVRLASAPT